jgi:peptidoglycan hydrolase-like protein with peptidoglycan-binding domain
MGPSHKVSLKKGDQSQEVKALKDILKSYDYLQQSLPTNESFDDATEKALKSFQKDRGLPENGVADEGTLNEVWKPQCHYSKPSSKVSFVKWGWKWENKNISYTIENHPPDVEIADDAIDFALETWGSITSLNFTPADGKAANMQFYFAELPGRLPGEVARTYPPKTLPTGERNIQIFFQYPKSPVWTDRDDVANNEGTNLNAIALHEVGHAIGLKHSDPVTQAIMYSMSSNNEISLLPDDLAGAKELYH